MTEESFGRVIESVNLSLCSRTESTLTPEQSSVQGLIFVSLHKFRDENQLKKGTE
jgi:hypothetical protein